MGGNKMVIATIMVGTCGLLLGILISLLCKLEDRTLQDFKDVNEEDPKNLSDIEMFKG